MIRDYNQVPPKRLCSHIAVYPPPQTIGKVNNGLSSTPIAIHGLYTQPESSGSKSAYKSATDVADLIALATIRIWYMLSDRIGSDRIGVIRLDHAMGSTKLPGIVMRWILMREPACSWGWDSFGFVRFLARGRIAKQIEPQQEPFKLLNTGGIHWTKSMYKFPSVRSSNRLMSSGLSRIFYTKFKQLELCNWVSV